MSDDLVKRLTYAALRPAARLAVRGGFALRDMKKLIELAYYQEARRRGLKMKEISQLMSISMAKVGLLSKDLKEYFLQPELEHGVGRQILSLLWAAPLSEARIAQALPEFEADEVSAALRQLVDDGRITPLDGRTEVYALAAPMHRLQTDPWMAKVDGLNTLLDSVSLAVHGRFFRDDKRSMVRNVAFRVRDEDLDRLREHYEQQLFPLICELDEAVSGTDDSVPIRLSILWAPDERETSDEDDD